MLIRIRDFKGEAPRRAAKLLGENAATTAKNVDLRSGRLVPWRDMLRMDTPTKVGTILSLYRWNSRAGKDKSGVITAATKANPCAITVKDAHGMVNGNRVYLYRVAGMTQINEIVFTVTVTSAKSFTLNGVDSSAYGAYTDNGIWVFENGRFFHWLTDVDVARSHIGQDTNERTVFTGDGAPKVTDSTVATGGTDYPVNDYDLGLPAPAAAITTQGVVVTKLVEDLLRPGYFDRNITIKTTDHGLNDGDTVLFPSVPNAEYLLNNSYTVDVPSSNIIDAKNTNPVQIIVDEDLPIEKAWAAGDFFKTGTRINIEGIAGMTAINGQHVVTLPEYPISALTVITNELYDYTRVTASAPHNLITGARVAVHARGKIIGAYGYSGRLPGVAIFEIIVLNATQFRFQGNYLEYITGSFFVNAREFTIPVDGTILPSFDYGGFWDLSDYFTLEGTRGLTIKGTITAVGLANPVVVTSTGHGLITGEYVNIVGVYESIVFTTFNLPAWHNETPFQVTFIDNDNFSLDGADGTTASGYKLVAATWEKAYIGGGTWITFYNPDEVVSKAYRYTYISVWGEEGPPSPVSNVLDAGDTQDIRLAGMSVAPSGSFNVTTKRIYRVLAGTVGETYRFVADVPVATSAYTDSIKDEDLGEKIPSDTWIQPPSGMHSVRTMDNGIMVGVNGNDVHFSEPFRPHAWPEEYRQAAPHNIITAGAFGNTVVVLTESGPVLYQGSSPGAISSSNLKVAQVCVAKRGLVELGSYGIIYPSPDGLISLSVSGLNIITKEHMTNKEWQEYNPPSMHAYLWDDRYVCFYTKLDGTQGGFIFDQKKPDIGLTFITTYATAGYNDPIADTLFLQVGDNVEAWAKGDGKTTYLWRSKIFEGKRQAKHSCGQIIADDYLDININIYKDGVLHHTRNVLNNKPFRFETKTKGREWQIELFGTSAVTTVAIAETVRELGEV